MTTATRGPRTPAVCAIVALALVPGSALAGPGSFGDLEKRLMAAGTVSFGFETTSDGAVESRLAGTVTVHSDGRARLEATGRFAGSPVQIRLAADGDRMTGGNGEKKFDASQPSDLQESLLLGFTRMGILHNLARLSAAAPPDRADGTLPEWLQVRDVRAAGAAGAMASGFAFTVVVDGEEAATARLYVDSDGGLPLARHQTVRFEAGEMHVVERYSGFRLAGP